VEPDGHAEAGEGVHPGEDREVDRVDGAVPEEDDRGDQPQERDDHPGEVRVALGSGH
jgi:hypothetical protein